MTETHPSSTITRTSSRTARTATFRSALMRPCSRATDASSAARPRRHGMDHVRRRADAFRQISGQNPLQPACVDDSLPREQTIEQQAAQNRAILGDQLLHRIVAECLGPAIEDASWNVVHERATCQPATLPADGQNVRRDPQAQFLHGLRRQRVEELGSPSCACAPYISACNDNPIACQHFPGGARSPLRKNAGTYRRCCCTLSVTSAGSSAEKR